MKSDELENDKPTADVPTPGEPISDAPLTDPPPTETAPAGPEGEAPDDEEMYEEEDGPNFTPLQRQFLWTITAVIALAVLLAAGMNIGYQELQRSRSMQIARAEDDYQKAKSRLEEAQRRDSQVLTNAYLRKDNATIDQTMNELLDALRQERTTFVASRRLQGFEEEDPPDSFYEDSGKYFMGRIAAQAAQMTRGGAQTRPSQTQPTTQTTAPAATQPPDATPSAK